MNKNLQFFIEQNYSISLKELSEDDGGGWLAEISDLPGCIADGETAQEAIDNIQTAKYCWIETAINRGKNIPLPNLQENDAFSGKFTFRMPKFLHKKLSEAAKKENISLNQYILSLISLNFGIELGSSTKNTYHNTNIYIQELSKIDDFNELSILPTWNTKERRVNIWTRILLDWEKLY